MSTALDTLSSPVSSFETEDDSSGLEPDLLLNNSNEEISLDDYASAPTNQHPCLRHRSNLVFHLTALFSFFTITRILVLGLSFYNLAHRWFVFFPFAVEATLSYIIIALIFWDNYSIAKRLSVVFSLFVAIVFNSFVLNELLSIWHIPNEIILEPEGILNTDWGYLHYILMSFFSLTFISLIIASTIIILILTTFKFPSHEEKSPKVYRFFSLLILLICTTLFVISTTSLILLFASQETDYQNCDPLDKTFCLFPWPSTFHMIKDNSSSTGWRVNLHSDSLPQTRDHAKIDPKYWNMMDGFPVLAPILFYFDDMSLNGTIAHENIVNYRDYDAKTVIIDCETNELIPHWIEIDAVSKPEPIGMIQPAVPLEYGRRYIIGVRNILNQKGEKIIPVTPMEDLINKKISEEISQDRIDYYHSQIFPILEKSKWNVSEIQLTWDFVTASKDCLLKIPRAFQKEIPNIESPVDYKIIKIDNENCSSTKGGFNGRTIWGRAIVPSFLSKGRGSVLSTNKERTELQWNGVYLEHPFMIRIPCSVINEKKPAFLLQYGHGLFGARTEARSQYLNDMLEEFKWVLVASEWYGMSKYDEPLLVGLLLSDLSNFQALPDNLHQGWFNLACILRLTRSTEFIKAVLSVNGTDGETFGLVDGKRFGYYGNSLGGIQGGGYSTFSPDIERAVLGVPGTPFSLILSRSADFVMWKAILSNLVFFNWKESRFCLQLWQMLWSPAESAGWLKEGKETNKRYLIQAALGDSQVSELGAEIMARGLNCSTVSPARAVYGIPERQAPFNGSAIVEWVYTDVPPPPHENLPPPHESDTHECPRREKESQLQIRDFLEHGVINQYCEGKCEKPHCSW